MRALSIRGAATLLLLLLALAAAAWADPAAVLVRFSGDVRIQRGAAGATVPAALGVALAAGDQVVVGSGASAVLLYRTGRVETLTRSTRVAAPAAAASSSTLFSQTVRTLAQVAATDAREKPNRTGMIRPIPGGAEPLAPRNDITILARRPTFSWNRVPGARRYLIQLAREGQPPERFTLGADTSWTLPASHPALAEGARYIWTVGDDGDGRPAPPQRFRVATAEQRAAVQRRIAGLSAAGLAPDREGGFLAALIYRDAGLWYEADAALGRLGRSDRAGDLYHQLRGETYDALGRLDDAAREFQRVGTALGTRQP